jgi:hypothetical protein
VLVCVDILGDLSGVAYDGGSNTTAHMAKAVYTTPICRRCRHPMKLSRTISEIGLLPELLVFHCVGCDEVETQEDKRAT